jgi:hypothetical protein
MELPISELLLLVASLCGMFTVIVYARGRFSVNKLDRKVKNKYEEIIDILDQENKQLKRKARTEKARAEKESIGIKDYDESDPMGAIQELIGGLSPLLPSAVQPFLRSPQILAQAEKLIKENPDQIKDVLSKFVKGTSKKNAAQTQEKSISDFDSMSV